MRMTFQLSKPSQTFWPLLLRSEDCHLERKVPQNGIEEAEPIHAREPGSYV